CHLGLHAVDDALQLICTLNRGWVDSHGKKSRKARSVAPVFFIFVVHDEQGTNPLFYSVKVEVLDDTNDLKLFLRSESLNNELAQRRIVPPLFSGAVTQNSGSFLVNDYMILIRWITAIEVSTQNEFSLHQRQKVFVTTHVVEVDDRLTRILRTIPVARPTVRWKNSRSRNAGENGIVLQPFFQDIGSGAHQVHIVNLQYVISRYANVDGARVGKLLLDKKRADD